MSEKAGEKKRGGRRAYLNDFRLGPSGEYSYKGDVRVYAGSLPFNKAKLRIGAAAGAAVVSAAAAGVIPAPAMLGFGNWYVIPFFALGLIGVFLMAWCAVRLIANGPELREYVHKAAVRPLPGRALFTCFAQLASVLANAVFLCINGFKAPVWASVLLPVLHMTAAAAAYLVHRYASALEWETVHKDTEESGFAEALELERGGGAETK